MKKKVLISVIILILLACFFGVKSYIDLKTYKKQVSQIVISDIKISGISDGIYTGSYETLWVSAKVEVTVNDNRITGIDLISHKNGRGKPAEIIPDKVIEDQSLKVDVVSGATSSSKVILKAIEIALTAK